ncbi:hypothetical protein VNI00_013673 [Paramarasmius palmivorus]|uniref:Cytochrome b5 heme-binding domain-containing protein n=1 Tax=Paramarasmius palmivorus TaxID=297713 RepID=A0AAW0BVZ8_9AGAR
MLNFRHDDDSSSSLSILAISIAVVLLPVTYYFFFSPSSPQSSAAQTSPNSNAASLAVQGQQKQAETTKSIMQPPKTDLAPPKDDPFTQDELKEFDGSDPEKPIYVAIKGTIFDVTNKRDVYGSGKSYNIFAGKDGSRGLGMSSLKTEDAVPDWSVLDEKDLKTLNDWHDFFRKRYNIVGKVTDLPESVKDKIPYVYSA